MCLHPESVPEVPEQTARIARAAFRRGNPYLLLRDEFPTLFCDPQFRELYPREGQPAEAPWRLALVTLLQFAEGLSDRQAAEAVRSRIDWKYLLGLDLGDPGFDHTLLSRFRDRLLDHEAEALLFETLLAHCKAQGLVKARGTSRTDSTHVLAAIRTLNRLELVGETMRKALEALVVAAPDWLAAHIPAEWVVRYGRRFEQYRLPKREADREALAVTIGEDGYQLLSALLAEQAQAGSPHAKLVQLPAVLTLWQVWLQQYYREGPAGKNGARVRLRTPEETPPATLAINSPHDPQARYSQTRSCQWTGYKVHFTESCDPESPLLIVDVQTTDAPIPDLEALPQVQAALAKRALLPSTQLADAGYLEAGVLVSSQKHYGVRLVGPLEQDTSWQARAQGGFAAADFVVDWEAEQVTCPGGKQSAGWKPTHKHGHAVIQVHFARQQCRQCPQRSQCTRAQQAGRKLTLLPRAPYEALQAGRAARASQTFAQEYAVRAGVEGTHSQAVRRAGLRHCRYVGTTKVQLEHLLVAAALNLVRVADWLAQTRRRATRRSPLATLIPACAA